MRTVEQFEQPFNVVEVHPWAKRHRPGIDLERWASRLLPEASPKRFVHHGPERGAATACLALEACGDVVIECERRSEWHIMKSIK